MAWLVELTLSLTCFAGTEEGFTDDPTVFYGSTHGRDHYPGTGNDPSPFVGDQAKSELDRRIVNRLLTPGPKSRAEFRVKWGEILSEMERFGPQLVIMSSGACTYHQYVIVVFAAKMCIECQSGSAQCIF